MAFRSHPIPPESLRRPLSFLLGVRSLGLVKTHPSCEKRNAKQTRRQRCWMLILSVCVCVCVCVCVSCPFSLRQHMTSDGKKGVIFLQEALSPCFGSQTHLSFPTPQGASVFSRFLAEDWYPSAPTKPGMIIGPCLLCPGTQPWIVCTQSPGPVP